MFKTPTIIFLVLIASSCSPKISNFNSYLPHPLPQTNFMPSVETVEGKPPKVVVFELDEGKNSDAKDADLGRSMVVNVENILTKNRLAELVDRKIAKKLEKEIALAEMHKTGSYKGPAVADYAVSGAISSAGFNKKYSAGYVIPNKNGGFTKTDPKFKYTGNVMGNLKIYELPSMQVVGNVEFSGKKSRSENVKMDNNLSIGGLIEFGGQKAEGLKKDNDLVRMAGKEAIENSAVEIKNFFAKKGFILEKRVLKNKVIFKISVGSADGIKIGDKFEVIGKYEIDNSLTKKSEIESRIIGSGKVADKIDPKSSWILMDDADVVNSIRLGDVVKFKYKRSFFDKAGRFVSNLM
jgi:hypothetical protein